MKQILKAIQLVASYDGLMPNNEIQQNWCRKSQYVYKRC